MSRLVNTSLFYKYKYNIIVPLKLLVILKKKIKFTLYDMI